MAQSRATVPERMDAALPPYHLAHAARLRELTDELACVAQEIAAQRALLRGDADPTAKQQVRDRLQRPLHGMERLRGEEHALRDQMLTRAADAARAARPER